jgi:cyclopropane-fatty-acyl-phospholipid synthase
MNPEPGTTLRLSAAERGSLEGTDPRAPREVAPRQPRGSPTIWARVIERLLVELRHPPLQVELWTGEVLPANVDRPVGRLRINSVSALLRLAIDPHLQFGECYGSGELDLEGDVPGLLEAIYRGVWREDGRGHWLRRLAMSMHRARTNTLEGSRRNIHAHYDLGNAFYAKWLGPTMAYTCAYYPDPQAGLDAAQFAKMEHVCRKLRLRPGETLVEAGCGWGSLALHAARHHGVRVRAFNISREQLAWARERAAAEGLADRVEFVEDDYRNATGPCDAFVSVGMLEHVGVEHYPGLGRVVKRLLGAKGRGLIHTIGRSRAAPMNPWVERRIFPGANPPSLAQLMTILEPCEFAVTDVENLRLHYARTLTHWLEAFERASAEVAQAFDERFVRMWRLYLAGSIASFRTGDLQLFQVCFATRGNDDVPWTRDFLYDEDARAARAGLRVRPPDRVEPAYPLPGAAVVAGSGDGEAGAPGVPR